MTHTDLTALLESPFGEVLARLLAPARAPANEWIDIRAEDCPVPYRAALEAAKRGELAVHRVGRRGLVRREELDAWIAKQPTMDERPEAPAPTLSPAEQILTRTGWRKTG